MELAVANLGHSDESPSTLRHPRNNLFLPLPPLLSIQSHNRIPVKDDTVAEKLSQELKWKIY